VLSELKGTGTGTIETISVPIQLNSGTSTIVIFSGTMVNSSGILDDIRQYTKWFLWLAFAYWTVMTLIAPSMRGASDQVAGAQAAFNHSKAMRDNIYNY